MQTSYSGKAPLALSALAAFGFGVGALGTSPHVFRGQIWVLPGMLAGVGSFALSCALVSRYQLQPRDLNEGLVLAGDAVVDLFAGTSQQLAPATKAVVSQLPPRLKRAAETLLDIATADRDWLDRLLLKSSLIAGITDTGKTHTMHYLAAQFLLKNGQKPASRLRIFDVNYGKRGNVWHDLPHGADKPGCVIFKEYEDLPDLIAEFFDEMERRRRAIAGRQGVRLDPWLLIADELNVAMKLLGKRLSKESQQELDMQISTLLYQGHGYGVFICGGVQSLAVGTIQLDEAQRNQMNLVLAGDAAVEAKEVSRVTSGNSAEYIERVKQLRKLPGGKRACVTRLAGEGATVKVVPEIDLSAIQVEVQANAPSEEEAWAQTLDWEAVRGCNSRTAAWEQYGNGRQGSDNPYYQAFCEIWNSKELVKA